MTADTADPIVGIDFGTSGGRVAAFIDGKAEVLDISGGEGTMPADVLVRPDGTIAVGAPAKREGPAMGGTLVHAAKRMLGREWDDPALADVKAQLGDALASGEDGTPLVTAGGASRTAAEICTLMLSQMRILAAERLGREVRGAVLAVPADYGAIQRAALSSVAAAAGLEIVRIVSEPTAAALQSCFGAENRTFAIYDLGGGTFDVSIVDIGDGVFEVLASAGDPFLGGEDIDARLLSHVLDRAGIELSELTGNSRLQLRSAVESLKRQLSDTTEADLAQVVRTTAGLDLPVAVRVSREDLQNLSQDLIDRSLVICGQALQLVGQNSTGRGPLTVKDIDEVVLVGGTTRLPFVEECVARYFGRTPLAARRREDAVALGCALYAGVLMGANRDTLLLDVTPRAYGIQVDGTEAIPFLPRNITHPAKVRHVHQTANGAGPVSVRVFEGETADVATAPTVDEVAFNAERDGDGRALMDLTLDIDANGGLELRMVDLVGGLRESRKLAPGGRSTVASSTPPSRGASSHDAAPPVWSRRFLAVATEWSSGAGGLSTLNRELCIALAAAGNDVRCVVLAAEAQERQSAAAQGVTLLVGARTPGMSEQFALARKPQLEDGWEPDIIIGHGRVTGPAALAIAVDHFPSAERMHVIHMAPNEIEWFKPDRSDDGSIRSEHRTRIERELGDGATYVVAVGPKLHNRYLTEFAGTGSSPLRLDPGFDASGTVPLSAPPGHPWQITFIGRAEDEELKGLDIAAKAMGTLAKRWRGRPIELMVRGAAPGTGDTLHRRLADWADHSALRTVVHAFTAQAEDVAGDLRRSSVVIMPSRTEGFGLVGLEAMCAGVPVLVSSESGLADLLQERLDAGQVLRMVVPVTNDLENDAQAWASAIERVLMDREAAFAHAAALRSELGQSSSWAAAIADLLKQMDPPSEA